MAVKRLPACEAKEIRSLEYYRSRIGLARLDYGPFVVAYTAAGMQLTHNHFKAPEANAVFLPLVIVGAVLHVLLMLFTHWSVSVKCLIHYSRTRDLHLAEWVKVSPTGQRSNPEMARLWSRDIGSPPNTAAELTFEFRRMRFVLDASTYTFQRLAFPDNLSFGSYRSASGLSTQEAMLTALQRWGPNQFEVPVPTFLELLKDQMLAPFFVFQVFCVGLWMADDYWMYSVFTLGMLIMFECTVVIQRMRALKDLRGLQTQKQPLNVYRCGKWDKVSGDALLPGDLVSLTRPHGAGPSADAGEVPADCLLLAGTAIVEEAVLTGESTPQWKQPIGGGDVAAPVGAADADILTDKTHKHHTLYGGTRVMQVTPDKAARVRTPDGGCLALVLRTGFETAQGSLIRTISHSQERVTANTWESGLFILFLLCFAVASAAYVVMEGLKVGRSRFKLYLNATMIITAVVPPELPLELTMAVNTALMALARLRVFCTEPFRIPLAGKVEVACFDKTGTLTSDNMLLQGVSYLMGRPSATGAELEADPAALPGPVLHAFAACHSLINMEGDLVGDPLEVAAFQATDWKFSGQVASGPGSAKLHILQRHHFSSALKRMSVVVRLEAPGRDPSLWVLAKGAPEVLEAHLAVVPDAYDGVYRRHASDGARVIATAFKALPSSLNGGAVAALSREQVEAGLTFSGFAVFATPLKADSEPTLAALRDSSHQLVMITGDAPLTACYVARKVHIVDRPVLILGHTGHGAPLPGTGDDDAAAVEPDEAFEWSSPDGATTVPFDASRDAVLRLAAAHDLCVGGVALHHLSQIGVDSWVVPLVQVFARVSPDQKEGVILALRAAGLTTLMCGDGTNDVGGLKAAHVGVALLATAQADAQAKAAREKAAALKGKSGGELATAGGSKAVARKAADKPDPPLGKGGQMLADIRAKGMTPSPQVVAMCEWMDSMEAGGGEDGVPSLKPGDASMASSFTAKADGVAPVADILKQGRCSLVTTVQMFKILGLMCLSQAFTMSVMYLNGVKLGGTQATVSGVSSAVMFLAISQAKPLRALSSTRPHPDIFSVYVFGSTLLQFGVHLAFLMVMYQGALAAAPFGPVEDPWDDLQFSPNLVNTVCYLVNQFIQISTFAVNYVGEPFNTGLKDNKMLFGALRYGSLFLLVVASNVAPGLSATFELVEIPLDLRYRLAVVAALDFALTFAIERGFRKAFPARRPPPKGYMRHTADLKRLGIADSAPLNLTDKKTQ